MKFAGTLRRLFGVAMAMLIAVANLPSLQAQPTHVGSAVPSAISLPALADQFLAFDGGVYLAEESDSESAQRTPFERQGGDVPPLASSLSNHGALLAAVHPLPPEQTARADDGLFRSPHKTGPPRI